jgi:hypothetical protein
MTNLPDFGALQRAVEMYSSPQVQQVLACLDDGKQPFESIFGVDTGPVDAAVRRLMDLGVIREVDAPSGGLAGSQWHLALTAKGHRVARLVRELAPSPLDDDDDRADWMGCHAEPMIDR